MAIVSLIPQLLRETTDQQLLLRFGREGDEAAFTELVRRHGPMVLGVCRRIIADVHLIDDAFQATFIVLARKVHTLRPEVPLANWLYGVVHNVALRGRSMSARRAPAPQSREREPNSVREAFS